MSRKPRTGDVVEVCWRDSEHINLGWAPAKRYRQAARHESGYRSAGYWLGGAKSRVTLVLSLDPFNGSVSEAMAIPRCAVTEIRVLGRSNKRLRRAVA